MISLNICLSSSLKRTEEMMCTEWPCFCLVRAHRRLRGHGGKKRGGRRLLCWTFAVSVGSQRVSLSHADSRSILCPSFYCRVNKLPHWNIFIICVLLDVIIRYEIESPQCPTITILPSVCFGGGGLETRENDPLSQRKSKLSELPADSFMMCIELFPPFS